MSVVEIARLREHDEDRQEDDLSTQPSRTDLLATVASYWWINDTVHDRDGDKGVLWAPTVSRSGVSLKIWENIRQLRIGDSLIHYSLEHNGVLNLRSVVIETAQEALAPSDLVRYAAGRVGHQVRVRFEEVRQPIHVPDITAAVRALAPVALKPNGYVRHGYAIPLTSGFVQSLREQFPGGWPEA